MPDTVDTVIWAPDDGWRYHPKHVQQFADINKLNIVASCWTIIDTSFSLFIFNGSTAPGGPGPVHRWGFPITLRHITPGRTPLDEWSPRRRDLYLLTRNIRKRQTFMLPTGFELAIPADERPQTHALGRGATGIGHIIHHENESVL